MFDPKCRELAEHFFPEESEEKLDELAQLFQDQAEMFEPSQIEGEEELNG